MSVENAGETEEQVDPAQVRLVGAGQVLFDQLDIRVRKAAAQQQGEPPKRWCTRLFVGERRTERRLGCGKVAPFLVDSAQVHLRNREVGSQGKGCAQMVCGFVETARFLQ